MVGSSLDVKAKIGCKILLRTVGGRTGACREPGLRPLLDRETSPI